MRISPLAALLPLVIAGCLGGTPPPAATDATEPAALPEIPVGTYLVGANATSLDPVVARLLAATEGAARYTGFTTFEPTIGVTPDGAIFMSRSASVVRSLDQGATWEEIVPFPFRLDNDPYVYVDPATGRVFAAPNQAAVCMLVSFSDDAGDSWTTSVGCPPPVNDHQTMVAATPRGTPTTGYPNILYMCTNGVTTTNCGRSLDGGLTWSPLPPAFVLVKDGCNSSLGHLAASPDGVLYLPKGNCGQPEVFVSDDDGLTWTKRVVSTDVDAWGHEVRVAVDEGGNVYAFWQGDDGLPYLAASTDQGATWTKARNVAFANLTGMDFPSIAAGAAGHVAFAYAGTSYPKPYEVEGDDALTPQLAQPVDIAEFTWHAYVGVSTNALDENATFVTVTAGAPGDPISRGECGRIRCDGLGDFLSITIGPDGRPWAAFADACVDDCAKPDGQENTFQGSGGTDAPGFVGTLARGPALRGNASELAPLPEAGGETEQPEPGASPRLLDVARRGLR